jgi:hypothetical protein
MTSSVVWLRAGLFCTGFYPIAIAMLSSAIGGYLAGRLRTGRVGVHSDEVYFRDKPTALSPGPSLGSRCGSAGLAAAQPDQRRSFRRNAGSGSRQPRRSDGRLWRDAAPVDLEFRNDGELKPGDRE